MISSSLKSGSSPWAQGGIAAAIYPPDTPNQHLEDTLKAGAGLCDQEAVQFLVDHATEAIAFLVKLGVDFDRQAVNDVRDLAAEKAEEEAKAAAAAEAEAIAAEKAAEDAELKAKQDAVAAAHESAE